jgi:hypothetical protein
VAARDAEPHVVATMRDAQIQHSHSAAQRQLLFSKQTTNNFFLKHLAKPDFSMKKGRVGQK